MTLIEGIGCTLLIFGVIFSFVGVVGVLRLPDTYTRLHATGNASTLGIFFLCLGAGILMPPAAPKLIVLGVFIVFTGPVASHAIAAAVYRSELTTMLDDYSVPKNQVRVNSGD
jgi:monovalent cation/proton antiporter MnhG/PhaG subunit